MSTIDKIMGAIGRHGDDCIRDADAASESFKALRGLIAAALEDARREGAEAMRDAAAKLARKAPLHYGSGEQADEELAQAIEDLPLPTGERQAVLLTDEAVTAACRDIAIAVAENCGSVPQLTHPHIYLGVRKLLAINGLEVRRG